MFKNGMTEEQIIAGMRDDFLKDATLRLDLLRKNRAAAIAGEGDKTAFDTFQAELHTLKGMGQAFGFPSLTLISRRLEGYLQDFTAETFAADMEVERFLDHIGTVIEAREEPDDEQLEDMLNDLPPPTDT